MSSTTEHELNADLLELEKELKSLVPGSMPEALLEHVDQSMAAVCRAPEMESTDHSDDLDGLNHLEAYMDQLAPTAMPVDMLDRMERAMDRWHEKVPVEEKVVPFDENEGGSHGKQGGGRMLAAAAAVALLGALSALIMPHFTNERGAMVSGASRLPSEPRANHSVNLLAEQSPTFPRNEKPSPRDAWVVPDSLSHKVTHASDQGVILADDHSPQRCIRVDFVDRIKVCDDQGCEFEIKRPGVRYMLVPLKTN